MNKKDQPVYMISIAAKLAGMHPQTLRIYERKQLVRPGRTPKSTRLYSERDIERLKYIQGLTQEDGVNLAGVKIIMELRRRLERITGEVDTFEQKFIEIKEENDDEIRRIHRSYRRDLVLIPRGEIVRLIREEK